MIDFTAADHITEREVVGRWIDCTPASMLETLRLALPDGRRLPTTMAEVDRLRAAAGAGPEGVTIDQVIEGAEKLYGLTDDDYTLTDDWNIVSSFLEDPTVVAVVQGRMGRFPFTVHRWDTYTGPHAVAKHDVRTLCDPLAPHGSYVGEEVSLAGWRAYFTGLDGAQAFAMHVKGGGMPVNTSGYNVSSSKIARVKVKTPILDVPNGKPVATAAVGTVYVAIGIEAGHIACLVPYGNWPDKIMRPTVLYFALDHVTLEDATVVKPPNGPHKVTIDGISYVPATP